MACAKYKDTNADSAVGTPAFAPALIAFVNRFEVNSHCVAPAPCCSSGITLSCVQSSPRERAIAASVNSRPSSPAKSIALVAPFDASASYTFSASGETFVETGGCFHALSPRRVNT
jgi:hypothetical protein